MAIKIIFNGKQVGHAFIEFKNYSLNETDDGHHEVLDYIDTTSIIEMHQTKLANPHSKL